MKTIIAHSAHSRFIRRIALIGCLVGLLMATIALPAPAAQAQVIRPAYFLWEAPSGFIGPCSATRSTYLGTIGISPRIYKRVLNHTKGGGTGIKTTYFWDNGFSSAFKYSSCTLGSTQTFRYYGNHKIRRQVRFTQVCWRGSCSAGSLSYGSWQSYRW